MKKNVLVLVLFAVITFFVFGQTGAGFAVEETEGGIIITGYTGPPGVIVIPAQINGRPVAAVGDSAFLQKQLTRVTIPADVTRIGDGAFAYNQLTDVTIPAGVTRIGDGAFAHNLLTRVTIPAGVTVIGDEAFNGNELTTISIPASVTQIGDWAFANNQLTGITIGANVRISDSFGNGFDEVYNNGGRLAGTYTRSGTTWTRR